MAIWQHDYYLIPQAKLTEYYGQIPETVSIDDYDKFLWWKGMPEPNPVEIERILPPLTGGWVESVKDILKKWGSDKGHCLSLCYGSGNDAEKGLLVSVELRIDLRQESGDVREFVIAMVALAKENAWCFRNDHSAILMPDFDTLAKDIGLSRAQDFVTTHPASPYVDDL